MPKGRVIHHQRLIGRIFRAAKAADYSIEEVEFMEDGRIIVRPKAPGGAHDKPERNDFDDGKDPTEVRQ
jgi:hypothetical protein